MLRPIGADPGLALPKPSLPVRLALLVAGTTLPLIIFAAGIAYNNYKQDRQNATQRVLETVRSIRLVLDSEMQRITGALQVLSLTNALRDRDFEGFRRIAQGFLDQYGEGGVVLVADREGRQVFSSLTPGYGKPAITQQPCHGRQGVRGKEAGLFQPVLRVGQETADRDGRSTGHPR